MPLSTGFSRLLQLHTPRRRRSIHKAHWGISNTPAEPGRGKLRARDALLSIFPHICHFVDGVAKHQSVLEETLREHREEIARLRLTRGEIPEDLRCPLTLELFCDPVSAADGHTYERVAIEEWLATGSRTSPSTGQPLQSTALIPQFTVKRLVVAFMETRRSSVDEDVP